MGGDDIAEYAAKFSMKSIKAQAFAVHYYKNHYKLNSCRNYAACDVHPFGIFKDFVVLIFVIKISIVTVLDQVTSVKREDYKSQSCDYCINNALICLELF